MRKPTAKFTHILLIALLLIIGSACAILSLVTFKNELVAVWPKIFGKEAQSAHIVEISDCTYSEAKHKMMPVAIIRQSIKFKIPGLERVEHVWSDRCLNAAINDPIKVIKVSPLFGNNEKVWILMKSETSLLTVFVSAGFLLMTIGSIIGILFRFKSFINGGK